MPKFYDHEKIEILTYKEYELKELYVEIPNEDSKVLEYYSELNSRIGLFIDGIPSLESPVMFQIKFDYYKLKDSDAEDVEYFGEVLKNLFVSCLINKEKKMEREKRLGIPKSLKSSRIGDVSLVTMVNHEIKYPIMNIELIDENNQVIERVF
jgi:hypothetical protein